MKKSPKKRPVDLSVIIVNYNTKTYLAKCLESIQCSRLHHYHLQTIVVDSASSDDSFTIAKKNKPLNTIFIASPTNIGFSAGNNLGVKQINSDSRYVLFLNPDTTVQPDTLAGMISQFDQDQSIDAATCNVILATTGKTQPECHRGFPTPWNAFCHFFLPFMPKLFPRHPFFNGYLLNHLDYSKIQPIDSCVGAFLMVKKTAGDSIGWWSQKYFMYGEDLDFGFQLKKHGYKLVFIPHYQIIHYQGVSSGLNVSSSTSKNVSQATRQTRIRSAKATTNAMRIFYRENLISHYSPFWQWIVWQGINLLEIYRLFRAKFL